MPGHWRVELHHQLDTDGLDYPELSEPETTTTSSSAVFTFSGFDTVTPVNQLVFMVSLDGNAFTTATSPVTYTNLAPGSHTFQVEAIDQANNVSTPASYTWTASAIVTATLTQQPPTITVEHLRHVRLHRQQHRYPANQLIFEVEPGQRRLRSRLQPHFVYEFASRHRHLPGRGDRPGRQRQSAG